MNLKNIILSPDIVLQNNKEYQGIYKTKEHYSNPILDILSNSVLLIPNKRVFERTNQEKLISLYKTTIDYLLSKNKNIYIARYDNCDYEICKDIKNLYRTNNKVILVNEFYNCIEYQKFVEKFEFLIASRFHSIVIAYKKFIPCVVIGWAVKYKELLKNMHQMQYLFDGKKDIDTNKFLSALNHMMINLDDNKETIKANVRYYQKESCFDKI